MNKSAKKSYMSVIPAYEEKNKHISSQKKKGEMETKNMRIQEEE